jgi:hypothetical protein
MRGVETHMIRRHMDGTTNASDVVQTKTSHGPGIIIAFKSTTPQTATEPIQINTLGQDAKAVSFQSINVNAADIVKPTLKRPTT